MNIKLKDLQKQIEDAVIRHGEEILEYDIAIECVHGIDLESKRNPKSGWIILKDSEDWEWITVAMGINLIDKKNKIIGISANF